MIYILDFFPSDSISSRLEQTFQHGYKLSPNIRFMIKIQVKLSVILHSGLSIRVPSWAITLGAGEIAEEGKEGWKPCGLSQEE